MFEGISPLVATLEKTSIVLLLAVSIALSLFLFLPESIGQHLGLKEARDTIRPFAGLAWLVSISLFIARIIAWTLTFFRSRRASAKAHKKRLETLKRLTAEEKGYLAAFILDGKNTVKVGLDDGIMGGLKAKEICYPASQIFDILEGMSFNLQPWARDHLSENQNLLDGAIGHPLTPEERLHRDRY